MLKRTEDGVQLQSFHRKNDVLHTEDAFKTTDEKRICRMMVPVQL